MYDQLRNYENDNVIARTKLWYPHKLILPEVQLDSMKFNVIRSLLWRAEETP